MKVLIIGDGLLGSEFKKQNSTWDVLSRKHNGLDITTFHWMHIINKYDVVINCVGYTNTYDLDKDKHWDVNYRWVNDLITGCNTHKVKLVHISTDYVYANSISNATEECVPVHHNSWYGYTKLLADGLVQLNSHDYLLIRCGHKPKPFPYDKAPSVMIGNFDYVDKIVEIITELILKNKNGVFNVGTKLKSMFELAYETNPNVEKLIELPISNMPSDISMDVSKLDKPL